jgi:hypothetical protein
MCVFLKIRRKSTRAAQRLSETRLLQMSMCARAQLDSAAIPSDKINNLIYNTRHDTHTRSTFTRSHSRRSRCCCSFASKTIKQVEIYFSQCSAFARSQCAFCEISTRNRERFVLIFCRLLLICVPQTTRRVNKDARKSCTRKDVNGHSDDGDAATAADFHVQQQLHGECHNQ